MRSDAAILERYEANTEARQEAEADARSERIEATRETLNGALRLEILAAMNGDMPSVSVAAKDGDRTIHDFSDLQTAVLNVIGTEDCADALLALLRESECPEVGKLKTAIAGAHADKHALRLATAAVDAGGWL